MKNKQKSLKSPSKGGTFTGKEEESFVIEEESFLISQGK